MPADLSKYPSLQRLVDTNPAFHAAWLAGTFPPQKVPSDGWTVDQPSRGLGDTVAKFTHRFKLDKAAKVVARAVGKSDCGCSARQAALNRLVPYGYPEIEKRHLIYHVYPSKANEIWRLNVQELVKRWDVFTGRKVVAVAMANDIHGLDVVKEEFGRDDVEWLVMPNDRGLREVATMPTLLDVIRTTAPHSVFYAHTKGNSNCVQSPEAIAAWRNGMYHHLLDDMPLVDSTLKKHVACGTHVMQWGAKEIPPFPTRLKTKHRWMFAGTFFWFRADAVFCPTVFKPPAKDRYGAEGWLSQMFPLSMCKSLWEPWVGQERNRNPYEMKHYQ